MKQYSWEGIDKRGIKMKGVETAVSETSLKLSLRKRGFNDARVREVRKPLFGSAGKNITTLEIAAFIRQLATMMQSGIPMVQAFEIVAGGQKNIKMQNLLEQYRCRYRWRHVALGSARQTSPVFRQAH